MTIHRRGAFSRIVATIGAGLALFAAAGGSRDVEGSHSSEWSAPVNLGADVNSAFEDMAPHLSSNGLALYFASNRPDSAGGEDLWVSRRSGPDEPWEPPTNLGAAINTAAHERSPALSRNRRLLFFATDRPGGSGGFDIWLSWRADPDDDFGWQPPVNLGSGINSAATDAGPSFFEGADDRHGHLRRNRSDIPQLYVGTNRPGGAGGLDIYLGSIPGGWEGPATLVAELSTPQADLTPTIRRNGLEIIFASGRPGTLGNFDLWQSRRRSVHDPWSTPTSLGPLVNSDSLDAFPSLSSDAETLVFQSARSGGFGGSDLYMTTRRR